LQDLLLGAASGAPVGVKVQGNRLIGFLCFGQGGGGVRLDFERVRHGCRKDEDRARKRKSYS